MFAHASGQWAKKIRKKLVYFGSWLQDPKGVAALETFNREWPYLKEGKTPPPINAEGCTLRQLCNDFLETKEEALNAGDLSPRTFRDYYQTCEMLIEHFGKERVVDDLRPDDFRAFRAKLAERYNVTTLKTHINRCSIVFKYAADSKLIEKPIHYGQAFNRPSAKAQRRNKNQSGPKLYNPEEIQRLIGAATVHLRAMIHLGINCGFGNSDVANLPQAALDLQNGWVNFPRVKTEIPRRIPLWPETVLALQESLAERQLPKDERYAELCFRTHQGKPWVRMREKSDGQPGTPIDSITLQFGKLLKALGIQGRGLGFYALRHCFETYAGESKDQVAVDAIMGHVDSSMAANYRHRISDERLRAVVAVVRDWLFSEGG